jgi:hypothetical protein
MNIIATMFPIIILFSGSQVCEEQQRIKKLTISSDLIFIGHVHEIEAKGICIWSGLLLSTQSVKYKVEKVLKGKFADDMIEVKHPLVRNSKTSNGNGGGDVCLSPKIFKVGNRLLVFVNWEKTRTPGVHDAINHDEDCGVQIFNQELASLVVKTLEEK